MLVENTAANRTVANAVASFAVDGIYFDKDFIIELLKVANGEKTSEELRQEILKPYMVHGDR